MLRSGRKKRGGAATGGTTLNSTVRENGVEPVIASSPAAKLGRVLKLIVYRTSETHGVILHEHLDCCE